MIKLEAGRVLGYRSSLVCRWRSALHPVESVDDTPEAFDSDEEREEFLVGFYASRRSRPA